MKERPEGGTANRALADVYNACNGVNLSRAMKNCPLGAVRNCPLLGY